MTTRKVTRKRKVGRPNNNRSGVLNIRLTPSFKQALKRLAVEKQVTMTAIIEDMLQKACK